MIDGVPGSRMVAGALVTEPTEVLLPAPLCPSATAAPAAAAPPAIARMRMSLPLPLLAAAGSALIWETTALAVWL